VTRQIDLYKVSGTRWTFGDDPVREWVESRLRGDVVNVCAGHHHLDHDSEIVRNDIDESLDADHHVPLTELPDVVDRRFDTVVYDPPWSDYQAGDKYDMPPGKINQTAAHKDALDALCRGDGQIISVAYTAWVMPARLGYTWTDGAAFQPYGRRTAFFGSVDRRVNGKVT